MADIAMLVAEEYERRIKMARPRKAAADQAAGPLEMGLVSILEPVHGLINNANWVAKARLQFADKVIVEPRTQFGVAALDSFFSA